MNQLDDFTADLFDDVVETPASRPTKNTFFPWHNPRKQYVRINQWLKILDRYKTNIFSNGTMKYLGLPGDDLLDIREIHNRFCANNNIKLNFLGFNNFSDNDESHRKENANLSITEVRELMYIDPSSDVIDNDILNIGRYGSLAYERVRTHGNFDVINLDFCDSVTKRPPSVFGGTHYNMITRLIQMQTARNKPWILFITTRIGENHVNDETLNILKACFSNNIQHDNFRTAVSEMYGIENHVCIDEHLGESTKFSNIILTSFCKWMLGYSLNLNPCSTISIEDVIEYKVLPEAPSADMISIALKFTPRHEINIDPLNLAANQTIQNLDLNESVIATRFISKIIRKIDCDAKLAEDDAIKEDMICQTIQLLQSARYDTSGYREKFE